MADTLTVTPQDTPVSAHLVSPSIKTRAGTSTAEDERIIKIRQAKEAVGCMLRYAIANPKIAVDDQLIAAGVDILRMEPETFDNNHEVQLWQVYSKLTQLIQPASDISIQIAEGLKQTVVAPAVDDDLPLLFRWTHWLGFYFGTNKLVSRCYRNLTEITLYLMTFVALYILVQCYSVLLSDSLDGTAKLLSSLESQQAAERLLNDQTPKEQRAQVQSSSYLLGTQLNAASQALVDLTKPLRDMPLLKLSNSTIKALDRCAANEDLHITITEDRNSLLGCLSLEREYAQSAYTVLSRYILPLLLGFIGATAYVTRHTLFRLSTNSYIPSPRGMLAMRLCLGGLLGAISGIFITSDVHQAEGFNISLTLTALVMGYSVEVAFSLFDSAIDRIKSWLHGLRDTPAQSSESADAPKP